MTLPVIAAKVTKAEDGWIEHTFRQSDLKSFSMCAERGRAAYFSDPDAPRVESAAALLGTALHAGIEFSVNSFLETGLYAGSEDMLDVARTAWREVWEVAAFENRFEWGKEKPENVRPYLIRMIEQFHAEVVPQLNPIGTEVNFDRVLLLEDEVRRIYLSGTIDLIDHNFNVLDWKTASRAYQRWEKQRWDIQPTVYTFAAKALDLIPEGEVVPFTYMVFVKGKGVSPLQVTRTAQDWDWLRQVATALAIQVESSDPAGPWMLNDTGWWCSPDWCSQWRDCKGASYPAGWVQ